MCLVSCDQSIENEKRARVRMPFKWGKRSFDSDESVISCDQFLVSIVDRIQNETDQFSEDDLDKMDACYLETREHIVGRVRPDNRMVKRKQKISFRWGRK